MVFQSKQNILLQLAAFPYLGHDIEYAHNTMTTKYVFH